MHTMGTCNEFLTGIYIYVQQRNNSLSAHKHWAYHFAPYMYLHWAYHFAPKFLKVTTESPRHLLKGSLLTN